jgi:hypothetical protein
MRRSRRDPARRVVSQGLDVERMHINREGYDRSGRYWGTGQKLYRVTSRDTGRSLYIRASSAKAAKADAVRRGAWKRYATHARAHETWGSWR